MQRGPTSNFILNSHIEVLAASERLAGTLKHTVDLNFLYLSFFFFLFQLGVFRSFSACTFPLPVSFFWHPASLSSDSPCGPLYTEGTCVNARVLIEKQPNSETDRLGGYHIISSYRTNFQT